MSVNYNNLAVNLLSLYEKIFFRITRDIVELQNLQSQMSGVEEFARRSFNLILDKVAKPFAKKYNLYEVLYTDTTGGLVELNPASVKTRGRVILYPILDFANFSRGVQTASLGMVLQSQHSNKNVNTLVTNFAMIINATPSGMNILYASTAEAGVFLNDKLIKISERKTIEGASFGVNSNLFFADDFKYRPKLKELKSLVISNAFGQDIESLILKSLDGLIYLKEPAFNLIMPYFFGYCLSLPITPLSFLEDDIQALHEETTHLHKPASILITNQFLTGKFLNNQKKLTLGVDKIQKNV
jgi:hypothetical protein